MGLRGLVCRWAPLWLLLTCTAGASIPWRTPQRGTSVVMLSDLHFDPYHDPAKVAALRAADINDWARILITPDSPTQAADFESLQKTCHARGADSSWGVMNGSLQAAHFEETAPLFVIVDGDLLTHNFDCRMRTLVPSATAQDVLSFAEKTVAFVGLQIRQSFPGVPVYMALGNNDSGCTDYHETEDSAFVRSASEVSARGFSKSRNLKEVLQAYSERGDYSVLLPSPMGDTRLVILQDIVESPRYQNCEGKPAVEQAPRQIAWLRAQLVEAKKEHQHVWVMAHIPPGVDEFASFHKYVAHPENLCEVSAPTQMLGSEALADILTEYADVVRLAIFAHTHMDEMKLLHNAAGGKVPVKVLPSISPVNGNSPAFTVAQVDPRSSTLLDYEVYVASNPAATTWVEEYRYSSAYQKQDFSAEAVGQLTSALSRDKEGTGDTSLLYQKWFLPGDSGDYARDIRAIWPSYACATVEQGGPAFHECMCPAGGKPASTAGSR